jgi:hypothetical protein
MVNNPYLYELKANLPRLLAMFDVDVTSKSYGMGDRYYWAWGLIDFGNGTFQGAAHGMARMWQAGIWPYPTPKAQFISRIDSLFVATSKLTRKDGSLEEAFPNEGSYCVTALVAFDLLCAHDLMGHEIDQECALRWRGVISPMIEYLKKADETHALISNHLAAAVAALARWNRLTSDNAAECKAKELLDRILSHQSEEGWFKEYEGADPGYQTLCTYYLADVHQVKADWNLIEPLRRSIQFLWHFAHPDGSFGGLYGSRSTRFYYPAGVLAMREEIPEAATLAEFMANSIRQQHVVTLSAIDEPNLIPTFNAYCWAAALGNLPTQAESRKVLPASDTLPLRKHFPQAGLFVDRGANHYTIISTHKGGVVYHFVAGKAVLQNAGVVACSPKGVHGSSQSFNHGNKVSIKNDTVQVEAEFSPMLKQLPSLVQFIGIRILCVSAFHFFALREWVKQQLVKLLITGSKPWAATNLRSIYLGEKLSVHDVPRLPKGFKQSKGIHFFVPIHMASQGYWQIQDEEERP